MEPFGRFDKTLLGRSQISGHHFQNSIIQGRYSMTLTDLGNCFYDKAVDEAYPAFKVSRADKDVAIGDLIESLLSVSFACKDGMLDWEWLGIDLVEWPPQRLEWENSRIEHLAYASYMDHQ